LSKVSGFSRNGRKALDELFVRSDAVFLVTVGRPSTNYSFAQMTKAAMALTEGF